MHYTYNKGAKGFMLPQHYSIDGGLKLKYLPNINLPSLSELAEHEIVRKYLPYTGAITGLAAFLFAIATINYGQLIVHQKSAGQKAKTTNQVIVTSSANKSNGSTKHSKTGQTTPSSPPNAGAATGSLSGQSGLMDYLGGSLSISGSSGGRGGSGSSDSGQTPVPNPDPSPAPTPAPVPSPAPDPGNLINDILPPATQPVVDPVVTTVDNTANQLTNTQVQTPQPGVDVLPVASNPGV